VEAALAGLAHWLDPQLRHGLEQRLADHESSSSSQAYLAATANFDNACPEAVLFGSGAPAAALRSEGKRLSVLWLSASL